MTIEILFLQTTYRSVFKVAFAGDSNVGKSSVITRFVTGRWRRNEPKLFVMFCWRTLRLSEDRSARVHIFDLAGKNAEVR